MENKLNLLPEMSDKFDVILAQIMKVKHEMGSTVKKDALNPFHKSRYATLGAHLDLCEPILFKHGLLLMHISNILDGNPILIATIHHPESGQWLKSYLPLPNPKGDSQGIGSSVTYMRRYSINSILGLNAEDDDGESACIRQKAEAKNVNSNKQTAPQVSPTAEKLPEKINPDQVGKIKRLEARLDSECKKKLYDWMLNSHKAKSIEEIPVDSYTKVLGSFENAVKFMEANKKELVNA